jgi:phosphatidylserine/phosphatidylglycerophosphate/cardiolipin synthase-like enzyme
MPPFVSPIADPASWTFAVEAGVTVPNGLRYAGYGFRGVRATRGSAAGVLAPAKCVLRQMTGAGGRVFVEAQVNPFAIRRVATALPFGPPTFYLVFDAASAPAVTEGFSADAGESFGTFTAVTLVLAGQDRTAIDPALWAGRVLNAMAAANTPPAERLDWQAFADALANAAINTGATAPLLLLDHAGQPLATGAVSVVYGSTGSETVHNLTLDPADGGDLQRTLARMNAGGAPVPANLWGGGASSLRVRLASGASPDFQIVRLEDLARASNEITVTPGLRHLMLTNLFDWLAPQFATPVSGAPLARFSRSNKVTPFADGPDFFDDMFRELERARTAGGGFHLAGWSMFPEDEFTKRRDGEPADFALSLLQAVERIGVAGGGCRFLPAKFIQLQDSDSLTTTEILVFTIIVYGIFILNAVGVSAVRTDGAGVVVLMALVLANAFFVSHLLSEGGKPLEQNKSAVETLEVATQNSFSRFSPYPARVEDNTLAPPLTDFPFDVLFQITRHFGVYHQKFSVVKTAASHVGYCGGVDVHPNRLDDANHLAASPFHDIHARVDGPAVRDLALTFEQRWARDGGGTAVAFPTPAATALGAPGTDVVQVARTYFAPADASRRLNFAPAGDRTIADTMLSAIAGAREFIYIEEQYFTPPAEYNTALINKVSSGDLRLLVVLLPSLNDQPFGELPRTGLINDLQLAGAASGCAVRVGYPRRRFTVPENELRASSGKCILGEKLEVSGGINPTIVLGPKDRLPPPPFWVAVEGELIWVYDESVDPVDDPETMRFAVDRGAETRLVKGGGAPSGARSRKHEKGAVATVINLNGIYVHSKMMIVDDVFLGLGSANLNRRGLFHDGEANIFTLPEELKASAGNPIAALRRKLWAEMMDLPAEMAAPLMSDPAAAARLFDRSPFSGNRFVPVEAYPTHLMFGETTGDALITNLLQLAGFILIAGNRARLYDGVVDPTSSLGS